MRWIVLAVALAGCGEVSPAGSVSPDGGAGAGGGGSGGTGAPAGGAGGGMAGGAGGGTSGTTGSAGAGGVTLPPSCAIPIEQINGTDNYAEWVKNGPNGSRCVQSTQQISATIVNGALVNFPDAGSWSLADLSLHSATLEGGTADRCFADVRYTMTTMSGVDTCLNSLFVTLNVPAL